MVPQCLHKPHLSHNVLMPMAGGKMKRCVISTVHDVNASSSHDEHVHHTGASFPTGPVERAEAVVISMREEQSCWAQATQKPSAQQGIIITSKQTDRKSNKVRPKGVKYIVFQKLQPLSYPHEVYSCAPPLLCPAGSVQSYGRGGVAFHFCPADVLFCLKMVFLLFQFPLTAISSWHFGKWKLYARSCNNVISLPAL